jgi:tRNA threonylcarbamoyladenosine modification (KEOPS) complex  Pcc1 subunit
VVPCNLIELHRASGIVQNAIIKLQLGHMTSIPKNYKASIQISFKNMPTSLHTPIAKCICSALIPDIKISFYSREKINISSDISNVFIEIQTDSIPNLRATINSYIRLINASYKCIKN